MSEKHLTREEAIKIFFKKYASPETIPLNVWMEIDEEKEQEEEEYDDFDPEEYDYDDFEEYDDFDSDSDIPIPTKHNRKQVRFNTYQHVSKAGANIELWPLRKFKASKPISAEDAVHTEFPNVSPIITHEEFQELVNHTIYHYLDHITFDSIRRLIPENTQAIILDPPLNEGFPLSELDNFFTFFSKVLIKSFIFVWIDAEHFQSVNYSAAKAELKFCDSLVVELFNNKFEPVSIPGKFGLMHSSRMIFIYSTKEFHQQEFAQQRSRDVGYGICRPCGKSRGRYSTPQVPHEVIEKMLPYAPGKERVFVEIWPSRMAPRRNWIFIDEKC
ncbi:hypothetical protein GPJ56_004118 [Histomonas meleagridis]|uniref:uncharacterized protein n=1 Tax=Histomonas meleagridis TaxID=135588 RepID=UPI0035596B39|nr:hypothetical protein GPJ56_004118 [Histomonas meleagridis]KAH0801459.1 hypothetical protein GO595_005711 [Histomonas meleagridis]